MAPINDREFFLEKIISFTLEFIDPPSFKEKGNP